MKISQECQLEWERFSHDFNDCNTDICTPYTYIYNFLSDENVDALSNQVLDLDYRRKENDLYRFWQSNDLKSISEQQFELVHSFNSLIRSNECIDFISKVTQIDLIPGRVDANAAVYRKGDRLLCHNDDIQETDGTSRVLAFVLYLNQRFYQHGDCIEGGLLNFWKIDASKPYASINPRRNSLLLFEVNNDSYHEVAEVLADKERVSISGWFYGQTKEMKFYQSVIAQTAYSTQEITSQVQQQFANESVVVLSKFFSDQVHGEWLRAAKRSSMKKQFLIPKNVGRYSICYTSHKGFLTSAPFTGYLETLTSLKLVPMHEPQLLHFGRGDYTLLHDYDMDKYDSILEVYYIVHSDFVEGHGGDQVYVCDDETLLTMDPITNTLQIVYSDQGVQSFTRYLDHGFGPDGMYRYVMKYRVIE